MYLDALHLPWLYAANTFSSQAMYLEGVAPNSSVDCFGFVTVQMTFNGLMAGSDGSAGLQKNKRLNIKTWPHAIWHADKNHHVWSCCFETCKV